MLDLFFCKTLHPGVYLVGYGWHAASIRVIRRMKPD